MFYVVRVCFAAIAAEVMIFAGADARVSQSNSSVRCLIALFVLNNIR